MFNSSSLFNHLVIDIETVPAFDSYSLMPNEWQILWEEKISKTMPESSNPELSYKQRGGILAEFGKIICISTGYFIADTKGEYIFKVKSIYGDDELALLQKFIEWCDAFKKHNPSLIFAGHNIREFDIPYICRRLIVHAQMPPTYLDLSSFKPWELSHTDTLQLWKFGDYKNYISLNLLTHVLGIPTPKTDIDGSQVQDVYYKDKNIERIVSYCQQDIIAVANILLKFSAKPLLSTLQIELNEGVRV